MDSKKQETRQACAPRNSQHKDVQKRYQQDFDRYQRQIEKNRAVVNSTKIA
ncbi:MAG: hypothetical protein IPP57_19505 [Candidatus Obscuribacter sp.]|jgi:hypothetical protein|nr:hypothetical protein [Candidatus Obscuribacter sp.]MBK7837232.1 hypothetical protein [Candidatus Obscuribacter sp.]MBK9201908.1 hypothetical protein [Candidatus Obscuribacter sp.]MBK9620194.1 hypothetical protein [Candidatus Obscuribacter sp.]MBK9772974.1 hypothetical protein [Candidatus Obscuribacter sp.]